MIGEVPRAHLKLGGQLSPVKARRLKTRVAYADRTTSSGIAIVTNGNRSVADLVRRFAPLGSAIRRASVRSSGRG